MDLSKQFETYKFELSVDRMTEAQAKAMLKDVYRAYKVQQETYVKLLGHSWGLTQEDS